MSVVVAPPPAPAMVTIDGGRMTLRLHPGQLAAHRSTKRNIVIVAGTQSGKTSYGPHWLRREIQLRGPGDYVVVSPSFPLMKLKALPEFLRLFEQQLRLGEYAAGVRQFIFSRDGWERTHGRPMLDDDPPTVVYFAHAQDPESLESATFKAAWLDEAGQKKFRRGSHEAIDRRLSLHRGRKLLTTTPYDLGYLYTEYWEPWEKAGGNHPDIDIINFPSYMNPAFPMESYESARDSLPDWRFRMFYEGIPTRPAGLIYGCFDRQKHVIKPFPIPDHWPRYRGLDFGGKHTAAICIAERLDDDGNRTGRFVAYREYLAGDLTAREHAAALKKGEPTPREPGPDGPRHFRIINFGGSKSEDQWRREFGKAGITIYSPKITEVEVGILRVFALIKRDRIQFFSTLVGTIGQLMTYSRPVDDQTGDVLDGIEDKEDFHYLDALRYIVSYIGRPKPGDEAE
jgi:hypothetical protein